jgi:hypothetical protein
MRAHAVIGRGISLYTQEQNGQYKVGFIYKTLNARLCGAKKVQRGNYEASMAVLREVCGELWPYAELLWKGLKLMMPTDQTYLGGERGWRRGWWSGIGRASATRWCFRPSVHSRWT